MTQRTTGNRPLPYGVVILHEDDDILVIDKPGGLLTISTAKEAERTAYWVMMDYVRAGVAKSRNRVFIVHRLDRETSGVLIFARSEAAKRRLQENWDAARKTYLALVDGHPPEESGLQESYLFESTALRVYSTHDPDRGAFARTAWRVLRKTPRLSLLEVGLLTGRKHQIRVHLAEMGYPIIGDSKYGVEAVERNRNRDEDDDYTPERPRSAAAGSPKKSGVANQNQSIKSPLLALHSWRLEVPHPTTGEILTFEAPLPRSIAGFIGGTIHSTAAASVTSPSSSESSHQPDSADSSFTTHPSSLNQPPPSRPDFAILTVSSKGKVHRRSKEVPLSEVLCRLLYPHGTYLDHKTKQPYTGPWPKNFDPANPPMPRGWTLNWPPPGDESEG
jgi:23S rRNA-/tRNA-specific pseudouridylate synthase